MCGIIIYAIINKAATTGGLDPHTQCAANTYIVHKMTRTKNSWPVAKSAYLDRVVYGG